MTPQSNVCRQYTWTTAGAMSGYAGAIAGLELGADRLAPPLLIAAALVPAAMIALQVWALLRFIAASDEYVRAVTAKRFILAAAAAFVAATVWGFLETYAAAPHVPAWMIYPAFWAAYGLVTPFVRNSRA